MCYADTAYWYKIDLPAPQDSCHEGSLLLVKFLKSTANFYKFKSVGDWKYC